MAKINWDKSYAEICGPPPIPGARLEQDGKYFRANGDAVGGDENATVTRQEIASLKANGLSDTEIGKRFGITRQKVTSILCK